MQPSDTTTKSPLFEGSRYTGRTLHDLVTVAMLRLDLEPEAARELETAIAAELEARMAAAIQDAQACAGDRPEYQHVVGYGALVGLVEQFLEESPIPYRLTSEGQAVAGEVSHG